MNIHCTQVDYHNADQCQQLLNLLNHYAQDPMGGGKPLSKQVQQNLPSALAALPNASSFILYVDDTPAGLANCFTNFSTFSCRSILNIHDFVIHQAFRNKGLSQKLMHKITEYATEQGCIKLTLEVLKGNETAYHAYLKFGFKLYQLDPKYGSAQFMEKYL